MAQSTKKSSRFTATELAVGVGEDSRQLNLSWNV